MRKRTVIYGISFVVAKMCMDGGGGGGGGGGWPENVVVVEEQMNLPPMPPEKERERERDDNHICDSLFLLLDRGCVYHYIIL